ncbi:MAG: maleate cis-trans isomerase family protein [Candidatus Binatia bacterium]
MRGWRGQIGYVTPTYLDDAQDWFKALPEGVNVIFATLGVEAHTPEEFLKARESVERTARGLLKLRAEAVILGGSPLAISGHGEGTIQLAQRLQTETGIPITTGQEIAELALKSLGLKRLLLVTPYRESLNQGTKDRLEKCGFEILCLKSALCPGPKEMAELAPEVPYRLAREAFREAPHADGIYIPNPKWQTMEIIEPLEADLKIPVVTWVQASVWWGLKQLKVKEARQGYGRLLDHL